MVILKPILGQYQRYIRMEHYVKLFHFISSLAKKRSVEPNSFILCMHVIDRTLDNNGAFPNSSKDAKYQWYPFPLDLFQMLGCTCLLLACKFHHSDVILITLFIAFVLISFDHN